MAFTEEDLEGLPDITENNEMQKTIENKQQEIENIKERFQVLVRESGKNKKEYPL